MGIQRLENLAQIMRIGNFAVIGNGIALSVSSSSSFSQFDVLPKIPGMPDQISGTDIMVVNAGTITAFITIGTTAPTAVIPTVGTPANGICILPGDTILFDKSINTYVAAITESSTTTLYCYQGFGS